MEDERRLEELPEFPELPEINISAEANQAIPPQTFDQPMKNFDDVTELFIESLEDGDSSNKEAVQTRIPLENTYSPGL